MQLTCEKILLWSISGFFNLVLFLHPKTQQLGIVIRLSNFCITVAITYNTKYKSIVYNIGKKSIVA